MQAAKTLGHHALLCCLELRQPYPQGWGSCGGVGGRQPLGSSSPTSFPSPDLGSLISPQRALPPNSSLSRDDFIRQSTNIYPAPPRVLRGQRRDFNKSQRWSQARRWGGHQVMLS